jgi:hypothetical protein
VVSDNTSAKLPSGERAEARLVLPMVRCLLSGTPVLPTDFYNNSHLIVYTPHTIVNEAELEPGARLKNADEARRTNRK